MLLVAAAAVLAQSSPPLRRPRSAGPEEKALFAELPVVEAASLHSETLEEAPADVSVITAQQIRRYGYRTLAEALQSVRSFYVTNDGGSAYYVGVRGFSLPEDSNTRLLVMLNGHYLTDNIFNAMYMFGQDFGLDMDLVERIEVVRGPSSTLYGSNGVFATINIVTRSPVDEAPFRASAEIGSFGQEKLQLSSALYLGGGANLLVSGSGFRIGGRTISAPEPGRTTGGVDAIRGYHTFANLIWREWSVTALFHDNSARIPSGWYGTMFGDPGTGSHNAHNYVEAAYTRSLGDGAELRWRVYYDQFRYSGRFDYPQDDGTVRDDRDWAAGDWVGSQVAYRRPIGRIGDLTVGGDLEADLRSRQRAYALRPRYLEYLNLSVPDRAAGVFAQQEFRLSRAWKMNAGLRLDNARNHADVISPRVGLQFRPSDQGGIKLMYGRAFRSPSAFESFYDDAGITQLASPLLKPEHIHSYEFVIDRRVARGVTASVSLYHYRLSDLIEGVEVSPDVVQFRNVSKTRSTGLEFELNAAARDRIETSLAFSLQDAGLHPAAVLANSPHRLFQFRAAAPLARNRLLVSGAVRAMSSRATGFGGRVPAVALADATVTTQRLHPDYELQVGVRNLLDRQYADPLSPNHLLEVMPQAGRSFFAKIVWRREN